MDNSVYQYWMIPAIYTIIVALGAPLNGLAVVMLSRKKKTSTSIYLLTLAMVDLFYLLFLPFKIYYNTQMNNWTLPTILCRLYVILFFTNTYFTLIMLAVISVDRYLAIVHPLWISRWREPRTAWRVSLVVMVVTSIHNVPVNSVTVLNYDNTTYVNGAPVLRCYEIFSKEEYDLLIPYRLYIFFSLYLLSLLTVLFAYGNVLKVLINSKGKTELVSHEKKMRAAKVTAVNLFIYVVCLTPFNSTHVVGFLQSKSTTFSGHTIALLRDITLCLNALNSLFDVLIIYIATPSLRKWLINVLKCKFKENQQLFSIGESLQSCTLP
ncbi:free fatty acid receptor 3-like [Lampetra fluviatilis]